LILFKLDFVVGSKIFAVGMKKMPMHAGFYIVAQVKDRADSDPTLPS